ncbi:MAG: ABC transporter substrate-binding protein [Spirochaetaceae bacterium]|jgi:iron complex transport system substrate-binding protein|nr:ABC transporter substrate-binding protein [Spirochaetaceae bacterium]
MKRYNKLTAGLARVILALFILTNGYTAFAGAKPQPVSVPVAAENSVTVVSRIGEADYTVDFPEAPLRAVSLSHFSTEMMLALGLEKRMAGVAWMDNEVLGEFKAAFDTIPILSDRYPSQEALLDAEPDFVTGWASAFSDKNFAPAFLEQNGIPFYLPRVEYLGANMDSVYEDITLLGKIFRVDDKAASVIKDMRGRIDAANKKIAGAPPVTVFVYDSGDTAPYTAGNALPSDLIRLAGGKNIYGEEPKKWLSVQWESVVEKNPDWIIVMQYSSDEDAAKKIDFLRTNAAVKNLDAVKNNRIFVMGLADLTGGPRNPAAVETMAKHFHPALFK